MITTYGDESSDETKKRVFAVGGLIATDLQWRAFEAKWKEITKGEIFHAAELEAAEGIYKGRDIDECRKQHRALPNLLAGSGIMGWATAADLTAQRNYFPKEKPQQAYFACFSRTVAHSAQAAAQFVPQDEIEFIFDQHPENEYNAGLLYQLFKNEGIFPTMAEKVSFASRKQIGIQAADLWTREAMKRCDLFLRDPKAFERPQWTALWNSHRFSMKILDDNEFSKIKHNVENMEKELGYRPSEYREWLKKTRRQHNRSNVLHWALLQSEKEG